MTKGALKRIGAWLLATVILCNIPMTGLIANAKECIGDDCIVDGCIGDECIVSSEGYHNSDEIVGETNYKLTTTDRITFKDIRGTKSVTAALADGTCKMYVLGDVWGCPYCAKLATMFTEAFNAGEFSDLKMIFLESINLPKYVTGYSDKITFAYWNQDETVYRLFKELADIACDVYAKKYNTDNSYRNYATPTVVFVDGQGNVVDAHAGTYSKISSYKKIIDKCNSCTDGVCVTDTSNTNTNTNNTNTNPSNTNTGNTNTNTNNIPSVITKTFSDVPAGKYYTDAVSWALAHKITNGTSDITFSPDQGCTRGQVVTFLWRAFGEPSPKSSYNPFYDVKSGDYYYKAVLWAYENDITTGTSSVTFSPNKTVTREQFVTFLWRALGKRKHSVSNPFTDVPSGQYYTDAVLWAYEKGITTGTSKTKFSPKATCTRGQVVTFIYRAAN